MQLFTLPTLEAYFCDACRRIHDSVLSGAVRSENILLPIMQNQLIREKEKKIMSEKNIIIRLETKDDYRAAENLTREAFWNVYRPSCVEHYVLHCYRNDPAFVPELDFVMELDGELIGQIIYVQSEIDCDDGRKVIDHDLRPHQHCTRIQAAGLRKAAA